MTSAPTHRGIDAERVRHLFAADPGTRAFIGLEVAERMASRLDYVRIQPERILDSHSTPAGNWGQLGDRFPEAQLTALHVAPSQLKSAAQHAPKGLSRLKGWLQGRHPIGRACVALDRVPVKPGSFDLVWSNLALHWQPEPHRMFPEWRAALKVGGLVMFSAFGPDTLREVNSAFRAIDQHPHVLSFTDMHDYGDMLVDSGFATPVMDMEHITLTYSSAARLWQDVRSLGGNPLVERRRGLIGRNAAARLAAALEENRSADGRLCLTFEVVYGHAWKAEPRTTAEGQSILRRIDVAPPRQ